METASFEDAGNSSSQFAGIRRKSKRDAMEYAMAALNGAETKDCDVATSDDKSVDPVEEAFGSVHFRTGVRRRSKRIAIETALAALKASEQTPSKCEDLSIEETFESPHFRTGVRRRSKRIALEAALAALKESANAATTTNVNDIKLDGVRQSKKSMMQAALDMMDSQPLASENNTEDLSVETISLGGIRQGKRNSIQAAIDWLSSEGSPDALTSTFEGWWSQLSKVSANSLASVSYSDSSYLPSMLTAVNGNEDSLLRRTSTVSTDSTEVGSLSSSKISMSDDAGAASSRPVL
eukprot:TRINITY_DN11410_c0_g2_i3.p1 TRINITY_DN11410_c0_g2~~TRINITY_DN11410_c0_g2_i3.p1  ORF type:complete len:294 (-),score=40.57 TRINITY_DN11410_c0_g2_i3:29-910(-)